MNGGWPAHLLLHLSVLVIGSGLPVAAGACAWGAGLVSAAQRMSLACVAVAIQSAAMHHLRRTCGHRCQVLLRRGCTVGSACALILPILALLPLEGHAIPAEQGTEAGGQERIERRRNAAPRQGKCSPEASTCARPCAAVGCTSGTEAAAALAQPSSAHHQSQKSACTEPLASSSMAPGMPSFRSGGRAAGSGQEGTRDDCMYRRRVVPAGP